MTAVQTGPTSIQVSWSPSNDATGYRIDYYSSGGYSESFIVISASINEYTLTGLQNGDTYTISIVATSNVVFHSVSAAVDVGLGESIMHFVPE